MPNRYTRKAAAKKRSGGNRHGKTAQSWHSRGNFVGGATRRQAAMNTGSAASAFDKSYSAATKYADGCMCDECRPWRQKTVIAPNIKVRRKLLKSFPHPKRLAA